MMIVELNDALTVWLHADVLALLARACRLASGSIDDRTNDTFDALGATFAAAATAPCCTAW